MEKHIDYLYPKKDRYLSENKTTQKTDQESDKNYRPVSILPMLSKILEIVILNSAFN